VTLKHSIRREHDMRPRVRRVSIATVVLTAMFGLIAAPAHAYGSVTWQTACSGYTGSSFYLTSTGVAYSRTQAGDNDEVGAAIRYYQGSTAFTHGFGFAERRRSAVSHGGYHQSYCFPGTQTRTT
jgi:hypothetical protein